MDLSENAKPIHKNMSSTYDFVRIVVVLMFIGLILLYTLFFNDSVAALRMELIVSAMIGGYMALNIGANDVANNVGPAVGSKALTMTGAIILAAICESAGVMIAGGEVIDTIKKGIIDPAMIGDADMFVWIMMAALLAGALWLNLATYIGAPVSTTHSMVGGVLGAGIAAAGWNIANWGTVSSIVMSWIVSPIIGGIIAVAFLIWIKKSITYQEDMLAAAKRTVPKMIALMVWAFSTYLILKGLSNIWKTNFFTAGLIGLFIAMVSYFVIRDKIITHAEQLENSKESINELFTVPLIFAAALLSFAHGANDVANSIGPLAAIYSALENQSISASANVPIWIMIIGAMGIALGLMLFGPKLIRTVGSEITDLDQMRAFTIAMAAAITVIIASQLGLPVSSTHTAIGAIFGIGFLREYLKRRYAHVYEIRELMADENEHHIKQAINQYLASNHEQRKLMLSHLKAEKAWAHLENETAESPNVSIKQELVKRSALKRIVAAWIITVPASALLAAFLFFTIRGIMV